MSTNNKRCVLAAEYLVLIAEKLDVEKQHLMMNKSLIFGWIFNFASFTLCPQVQLISLNERKNVLNEPMIFIWWIGSRL